MNYFSPGLRELTRLAQRATLRLRVTLAQRSLAAAETELGLLGWQQADFDPDTQRQVDAIQNVEREQAALTNRSAEIAREIETVTIMRDSVRNGFAQQRAALETEREKARAPLAEIDRTLRVLRDRPKDTARRIADLALEQRETDALYTKLLGANPQTQQVRDEIMRLRERLIAIPNETADIKAQEQRATNDIHEHEQQRAAVEQNSAQIDKQLRELKAGAEQRDAGFTAQIKTLEKERARAEATIQRLDRAKRNPYREVGRVLAECGVAPVNQPHTITRVHDLWKKIADCEAAIATSHERTAAEDRTELRISLTLWAVIALAAFFVLGAVT